MAARKTKGTQGTPKKRGEFLAALMRGQSVTDACETANLVRRTAYKWRDADAEFAADWDHAEEQGTDAMEDEAKRRAVDGVDEPVYYQGKEVGKIRRYSDTLLMFLLKGRRPEKFKDRVANGGDADAPPIKHEHTALAIITSRLAGIAARNQAAGNA